MENLKLKNQLWRQGFCDLNRVQIEGSFCSVLGFIVRLFHCVLGVADERVVMRRILYVLFSFDLRAFLEYHVKLTTLKAFLNLPKFSN